MLVKLNVKRIPSAQCSPMQLIPSIAFGVLMAVITVYQTQGQFLVVTLPKWQITLKYTSLSHQALRPHQNQKVRSRHHQLLLIHSNSQHPHQNQ
jgi:hypothetical protein